MRHMDRRRFVIAGAATAATLKCFAQEAPAASSTAKITLHPGQTGPAIPANFVGLSYETQQLSETNFFSPANAGLIDQLKALSPHGVLRIGGNTSDVGWWKATPDTKKPPLPSNVKLQTPKDEKNPEELAYAVLPEAVKNLRAFLDATGWTCIYGINLGTNTPELAAQQAVFVARTLGDKLEYFQVGNEPDGFPRRFRDKATWNANTYLDDWLPVAKAIQAAVPSARFGLPDVASNVGWLTTIADRLSSSEHPNIAALTHHYYFTGPPSNPKATIPNLLHADPKVKRNGEITRAAAEKLHVGYRMTEGNSCYRGGKPGFSDVFAASLWAADYMLTLASMGYSGVNLHGGEGKMVADSLGGRLPGEALMPNPNAPHPRPFYTPIADIDGKFVAEPVSFGMRFAQRFAGANLIGLDFNPGDVNATAYAAKLPNGETIVAIINKDESKELTLNQPSWHLMDMLTAPSLTSTDVHFGPARASGNNVPATSAAMFRVG